MKTSETSWLAVMHLGRLVDNGYDVAVGNNNPGWWCGVSERATGFRITTQTAAALEDSVYLAAEAIAAKEAKP